MKTHFVRILMAAMVAAGAVQAQSQFKADIPFQFVVGHKTLPAGRYTVDPSISSKLVVIQSADHRQASRVLALDAIAKDYQQDSKLVFHRYGDRYFLAGVWTRGAKSGWTIQATRQEQELAAQGRIKKNQTTVALR
jgi:hypothetical protein